MFRLGTSSLNLPKIAKNATVCPEEDNIRIVIYLDNMLIMGQTMEEILMSRDTLIFLLQHLSFVLSLEKSILNLVQEIEFLGGDNKFFEDVSVFAPREGVKNSESVSGCSCQRPGDNSPTHKILGPLASTIQAVLPAQVNARYLQQQQIKALRATQCYQASVLLNSNSKEELQW